MGVLLKIAYRNLREHKTKTAIIGSLIALGMVILVVGNSALDTATAGVRANYIENYTGHVIVAAAGVESPALTPDGAMHTFDQAVPSIPRYPDVAAFLDTYRGVSAANPLITGMAMTQIENEGFGFMQFYGVDPAAYQSFFADNLDLVDGSFLAPGESGLVISEIGRTMLSESSGREIAVGDSVLLTSQSKLYGTKIREIEIVGVFEFRNASLVLDFISFIDLENARVLNGMTGITDLEAALSERERALLGVVDEEALFGGGLFGGEPFGGDLVSGESAESPGGLVSVVSASGVAAGADGEANAYDLDTIIGDASERTRLSAVDENAWHYVLLKLDSEAATGRVVRDLNRQFAAEGWDLVAFEWLDGAGQIARFTFALKTVFNILVVLVAVVAVIIIMNTLVISVTERIPEIGTMRAIGAQKVFVRRMVMLETLMIAVVAGGSGVAVGAAITAVLGAVGIESTNMMLQAFMGGPVLNPVVSIGSVATSLLAMVAAGLLASLYPAAIALRIAPVTAMNVTN